MDAAGTPLTPRPNDTAAHTANPWTPLPSSPGDALTRFKDLSALLLMVSLTALALLANAAVLAVIVRAPHLRKFAFVCHLCAVDLLCAALLMPLAIASGSPFFFAGGVPFSAPECRAYVFLTVLLVAASVFTVAVISVERYYYIVHPMRYEAKMTLRLAAVVMAAVWAAAALLASAAVFGWPAYGGPSSVGGAADARRSLHCGRSSGGRRGFYILFCVACFCAPAGVMCAVYCGVYKVARGAARRHGPRPLPSWTAGRPKRRSDSVNSQTAIVVVTTRSAPRRRAARDKASGGGKAALTLVVIVGQFLLCWLPYFAYHLHLTLGSASPAPAGGPAHAEDAVTWLAYSSFAVNPFFYGLLNRQILEELCKLRRCCSAGRPAAAVALASGSHDGSAAHDNFLQFLQRTGSTAETRASLAASSSSPRSTLDQSAQASGFRIPGQIPEEAS